MKSKSRLRSIIQNAALLSFFSQTSPEKSSFSEPFKLKPVSRPGKPDKTSTKMNFLALILVLLPCLNADWLNPTKLKILPSSDVSSAAAFDESIPKEPRFDHNVSACVYSFHDRGFLRMKRVTLSNEEYFQGRTNCSIQFYNLPKGLLFLTIGSKKGDVLSQPDQRYFY